MYPMLKEGVCLGVITDEEKNVVCCYAENEKGDEYEVDPSLFRALLNADGTKPLELPDHGKGLLRQLKRYGLIRTSRFVRTAELFNRFILFPVRNNGNHNIAVFRAVNSALPIISVAVFCIGLLFMMSGCAEIGYNFSSLLYYTIIILSLILHEAGHFAAGRAYGYKFSDIGLLLLGVLPVGAYVAHEVNKKASRREKMQVALAGIEANLLVAGICFFVAMFCYLLSRTMVYVATVNIAIALLNLLPIYGFDGENALCALFGVSDLRNTAKKYLFDRKFRRKLLDAGIAGYICIGIFGFTLLAKILFWVFVGLDHILVIFNLF